MPDFNCDQTVHFVLLGDSLAYGFGDTKNGDQGGYALRAQAKFPNLTISNLGEPGLRTLQLILKIQRAFKRNSHSPFKEALLSADVVFLDLGRNDRWLFGEPLEAYRNLKRIASMIKSSVQKAGGVSPLVVKAVLMLPNRGSQGPWVAALNDLIKASNSLNFPADLRFDTVSKRLLSFDQIHPTSKGYAALASVFIKYIKKSLPGKITALRPDLDSDGVYDLFETSKYFTDPTLLDSDGDGVSDGDELFVFNSDPLSVS